MVFSFEGLCSSGSHKEAVALIAKINKNLTKSDFYGFKEAQSYIASFLLLLEDFGNFIMAATDHIGLVNNGNMVANLKLASLIYQ